MRRALLCVLFGIALVGPPDVQAKTDLLKTQPGSVVHWSQPIITVGIDASAGSKTVAATDASRALELATRTWNEVRAEQPKLRRSTGAPPDVSIRFCRGRWQGDTIDLGRSRFTASLRDGTVTSAIVEINECDHGFSPPEQHKGYDLQAVLTHELGHVLGLGHSDNRAAIMFPSGGGASVRAPHVEDQTALALIYLGRTSTEPLTPSLPLARDGASPAGASLDASLRVGVLRDTDLDKAARAEPAGQIPLDSVPVLSFKTSQGRSVMVYTCEPTLLPPIESAPVARAAHRRLAHHARRPGSSSDP